MREPPTPDESPTPSAPFLAQGPDLAALQQEYRKRSGPEQASLVLADQCRRWDQGERVPVEAYLQLLPELEHNAEAVLDLIYNEFVLRQVRGEVPQEEEYCRRFPEHGAQLRCQFSLHQALESDGPPPTVTPAAPSLPAPNAGLGLAPTLIRSHLQAATRPPAGTEYEILEELGHGGMGVVYKARQVGLNRLVALKRLRRGDRAGPHELVRFRLEAEAVARLQHPNIVQIYEVGSQDGLPFFSLELVDGGSLAGKLQDTALPAPAAARLLETLARAMHYAHEQGIVHRDLKPHNVLLTADGTPKITDFGLAKRLDEDSGQTHSGVLLGTPSYMAPEQAGSKVHRIGPLTDVYALGAVLYECLTGRPPFKASQPMDTVRLVLVEEPVPVRRLQPKCPRDLETVCLKCLQKDPRKRYRSALELAEELRRFQNGEPIRGRPTPAWERAGKWAWRRPTAALALAAGLLLVLSSGVGGLFYALYAEQRARFVEKEASAQTAFAAARIEVEGLLDQGARALAADDGQQAEVRLHEALARIGAEPRLAEQQGQAERLLAELKERQEALARVADFERYRKDALFHGSGFTGRDRTADLQATRTATRLGLELFGVADEGAEPPRLPERILDAARRRALTAGCYELLLLRAEAVARPLSRAETAPAQARLALRILDHARALLGRPTPAWHLQRAECLARLDDAAAAAVERKQAVAPDLQAANASDYFLLGKFLLPDEPARPEELEAAARQFESALRLDPGSFWARYFLAATHLRARKPDLARAELGACASVDRDFVWIYILKGYAETEQREFQAAAADFATAAGLLERHPDPDAAYVLRVNRGVLDLRQEKFPEAIADLEEAIRLKPEQFNAHANLAQVYHKQGKLDEAVREFGLAIADQPRLAALYRDRARLDLKRKDLPAALADFEEAIRLEPAQGLLTAADCTEKAHILHRQDRREAALAAYDAALALVPDYLPAQQGRAELLVELKRYPAALAAFDAYLRKASPTAEVLLQRGLLRTEQRDYAGAVADFSRALELRPERSKADAVLYAHRGWVYVLSEAPHLAGPDFEEAIRLDPADGDAYNGRGLVRVKLGQDREAVADAEQALRLGPATARTVYNAARICALAGSRMDAGSGALGRPTPEVRTRYRERALELLRNALALLPPEQRSPFWQNTVENDAALVALRRSPEFARLAAEFPRRE